MKNLYKIDDELYIISNTENVNENCWIITDGKLVQVSYLLSDEAAKGNKIILITNKLLITDGIQAIDDDFLKWLVKNPSCESVEVKGKLSYINGKYINSFKIIIPQEEPKQNETEHLLSTKANRKRLLEDVKQENKCFYDTPKLCENSECRVLNKCNGEFQIKQETLQEAAINNWDKINYQYKEGLNPYAHRVGFKEGAKWQSKRMYSEEDIKEAFRQGQSNIHYSDNFGLDSTLTEQQWFEQFKKKNHD